MWEGGEPLGREREKEENIKKNFFKVEFEALLFFPSLLSVWGSVKWRT